ncbi:Glutathione transport system permease protein GsiC [Corynebacterium afermentans subsp. afermentans]|uniref:Peptide/nickel transport system permease protein n=1 Tax=Corynebacterium afermentans TaxID=38286 RepID=A0A9X8R3Z3_9CORY|nr:ABC transporter permease [Corynebacterium afermentans]OAA16590.1 ABC transporter permease [Corynebacterium afermentans subsp. afermentans]WJY57271.1 Glutathione transport system permease protein GsiC [Corynebacterium afermentans subsp. afermentans]SIQ28351.1 peptide/nickel transport system permease protein [Corynebacterium afermentans]
MIRTIGKHILRFVLLLAAASVVIFTLLRSVPGDPARVALGVSATEEAVAELSARLGLDQPLPVQYFDWVSGLLTGDFGISMASGKDITDTVLERAGVSLTLTLVAMAVSLAVAVPVGVYLARRTHSPDGVLVGALSQVGIIVPSFLVGIALVALFSVRLGWLPANGWGTPAHAVLPVASLALVQTSILTRYVAASVREEMGTDYVRTGRALGASIGNVLFTSALRNAALPVFTVVGVQLASLVVGAVVIERVFTIPGLGTMLLDAVGNRDLATVQTVMMVIVAFTLVVNLIVDLTYAVVDPRIRRQA